MTQRESNIQSLSIKEKIILEIKLKGEGMPLKMINKHIQKLEETIKRNHKRPTKKQLNFQEEFKKMALMGKRHGRYNKRRF